ncbi:MAG: hypothetical protein ACRD4R_09975 [Candidatus Acidiferrales bacterium]
MPDAATIPTINEAAEDVETPTGAGHRYPPKAPASHEREEYNRKAKVVEQFFEMWQKGKTARELASCLDKELEKAVINDEHKQNLREMADWIAHHAENIDPLAHVDWMIRKFNARPGWGY